ncbi:MAG: non-homologous end-joining DNA ligase [Gemmatimonadales bacterium]
MTAVAGIRLTNPERVVYPEQGLTKHDVASYYEAIGEWMLPHVERRPFSLVRCPAGRKKTCFYQKHWTGRLPDVVKMVTIKEASGRSRDYTYVEDVSGLVALVQNGVLEFHVWGARTDRIEQPDRIVFDLDPSPEVSWIRVKQAARELRGLLREVGLESWVKTTGGKGLHLVIPLTRQASWKQVAGFARLVAYRMERQDPEHYIAKASKAARRGKIFVDWLRNTRGATFIAPWSTRARPGAPVSAPISWEELSRLRTGDQFRVENAVSLAQRRKTDPWDSLLTARQRLPRVSRSQGEE